MNRFALACALGCAACSSRPHVGTERDRPGPDGGRPAVVLVDRPVAKGLLPPLVEEREPNDDLSHAQPLELPKGVHGTIGPGQPAQGKRAAQPDVDVYQWLSTDAAPVNARVELSGAPGAALQLELLDGDGKRIASAEGADGAAVVLGGLTAIPGATRYLRVRPVVRKPNRRTPAGPPPTETPTSYTLVVRTEPVSPGDESEPNDALERATVIAAAAPARGFFGWRRDEDWLKLDTSAAPAGSTLRLELSGVEGVAATVRVLASDGKSLLAEARGAKGDEVRLRDAPLRQPATYVVLRAESGQNPDQRWSLLASIEAPLEGAEAEPNDAPSTANRIDVARPEIAGFLWPGDADVFQLQLAAPGLVRAELDPPDGVDVRLEWIDRAGHAIQRSDEAGAGKPEILPDLFGAEFLLRVTARARDTAFDAPYKLTVAPSVDEHTEREPNDKISDATALPELQPVRGYIAPRGDEDWYRLIAPPNAGTLRASVDRPSLTVKLVDESRAPLGPAGGASASGPVQPGKSYLVQVRDPAGRASPSDPYTLTIVAE